MELESLVSLDVFPVCFYFSMIVVLRLFLLKGIRSEIADKAGELEEDVSFLVTWLFWGVFSTGVACIILLIIVSLFGVTDGSIISCHSFTLLLLFFLIFPIIKSVVNDEDVSGLIRNVIEGVLSVIVIITAVNLAFYFSLSEPKSEEKISSSPNGGVRSDLMNHIEANYPLLARKWFHINNQITKCKEYHHQLNWLKKELDGAVLTEQDGAVQIPDTYYRILDRLDIEIGKLEGLIKEYESFFERSYAEKMIRNIDSDEELKKDVERLIKSTDLMLSEKKIYDEIKESINENGTAMQGGEDVVKNLTALKVDVNLEDKNGETALGLASENGHVEEARIPGTLSIESENDNVGKNRITQRAINKLEPLYRRMAKLKCKEAISEAQQMALLDLLDEIKKGADINVTKQKYYGGTALHYSCAIGSLSITNWLLDNGANPNAKTDDGITPLMLVGEDNREAIIQLLKKHGAR